MDNSECKIIQVSNLIESHEDLFNSNSKYGDINSFYKDHDHNEDEGSVVTVEDSSVFRLGEQFFRYTDLLDRLNEHSKTSYIHYWRRDSRTVDGAHMKTSRPIAPSLKYYSVKFACIFGGQKFMSRAKGKRPSISRRTNCPSHITVRANKCGQSLEVISVCNHHNHLVSKELYHQMPHDRRLPPDIKEDVLDLLRLGFNQKRVRDYIEWETGKKLSNKDIHNLVTVNKRLKVLISEKRALQLEQILTDFEANKDHIKFSRKSRRKHPKKPDSLDIDSSTAIGNENAQLPFDISDENLGLKSEDAFPVSNEIEISIEDGISCVPTLDGNFLTYIHNQRSMSPNSNAINLEVTNEDPNSNLEVPIESSTQNEEAIFDKFDSLSKQHVYLEGKMKYKPNDVFIFHEGTDVSKIEDINLVAYESEEVIAVDKQSTSNDLVNLEESDEEADKDAKAKGANLMSVNLHITETGKDEKEVLKSKFVGQENVKTEKQDEVVYFSDSEVVYDETDFSSTSNFEPDYAEPTCCETCGALQSDIRADIDKLKNERDELLEETAILRDQKSKLLSEILCLKNGNQSIECDKRNISLNELANDNVWIVIG